MKVQNYGSNQTLIEDAGIAVFYSYETPVVLISDPNPALYPRRCFITDKKWSTTTSKHINKFLRDQCIERGVSNITSVPQDVLDDWRTHEFIQGE